MVVLVAVSILILITLTQTALSSANGTSKLGVYLRIIANHFQMLTALATIDYTYGWSDGALKLL